MGEGYAHFLHALKCEWVPIVCVRFVTCTVAFMHCLHCRMELSSNQVKNPVHQESVLKWKQETPALAAPGVFEKYTLLKQLGYKP